MSNSYHNYGFFKLNEKFKIIGRSTDKSIELAEMRGKKILCMMFHQRDIMQARGKLIFWSEILFIINLCNW